MATAKTELQVVISAKDEASGVLKNIQATAGQLGKHFTVAGTVIAGALGLAVKEAANVEASQNRLAQILKTTQNASKEQVDTLLQQARALEKLGVVSDNTIIVAQGQLATFDLQTKSIENLIPAVLNYAVAEKGATVSTEELKAMTNGLAQALQGNFGSLTRTGFVLDDATKALISNGTEAERVEALVKVLNSTYAGFNESARLTAEGGLVALKNSLGNVAEQVGTILLPIINNLVNSINPLITRVTEWADAHPELTKNIVLATAVLGSLLLVLGPVLLMISAISAPLIFGALAISALALGIFALIQKWEEVKVSLAPFLIQLQELWRTAVELIKPAIDALVVQLIVLWDKFKVLWEILQPILIPVLKWIGIFLGATLIAVIATAIASLTILAKMIETLIDWFNKLVEILTNVAYWFMTTLPEAIKHFQSVWSSSWDAIKAKITSVVDYIQSRIDAVIGAWNKAQALVSAPISSAVSNIKSAVSSVVGAVTGRRAGGGSVEGGSSYLVGERGAELFTPMSNGFITPNNALAGAGGGIVVNINGGTYLSERVAIEIGDMIVNRLKMVSKIRV